MILLMGTSKEYKPIIDIIDATSAAIRSSNVEAILIRNEKHNSETSSRQDSNDANYNALQAEVTALRAVVMLDPSAAPIAESLSVSVINQTASTYILS